MVMAMAIMMFATMFISFFLLLFVPFSLFLSLIHMWQTHDPPGKWKGVFYLLGEVSVYCSNSNKTLTYKDSNCSSSIELSLPRFFFFSISFLNASSSSVSRANSSNLATKHKFHHYITRQEESQEVDNLQ
jgi:hypothetical protein